MTKEQQQELKKHLERCLVGLAKSYSNKLEQGEALKESEQRVLVSMLKDNDVNLTKAIQEQEEHNPLSYMEEILKDMPDLGITQEELLGDNNEETKPTTQEKLDDYWESKEGK